MFKSVNMYVCMLYNRKWFELIFSSNKFLIVVLRTKPIHNIISNNIRDIYTDIFYVQMNSISTFHNDDDVCDVHNILLN